MILKLSSKKKRIIPKPSTTNKQTNKQHYILKSRYKTKGPASSMSCSHFYLVSQAVFQATSSCMQQQANHPLVLFVCNSFGCAQSRVDSRSKNTHTHTRLCCSCAGWRLPTTQAFVLALPPSGNWRFASALVHEPGFKTPQKWQFSWATFLFLHHASLDGCVGIFFKTLNYIYRIHPFLTLNYTYNIHPFLTLNYTYNIHPFKP